MSDPRPDRRTFLVTGAVGIGAILLRPENAMALLASSSESTWVLATAEAQFADSLEATLLGTSRRLRITLSPKIASGASGRGQLRSVSFGQTIAAEGVAPLGERDNTLVALQVVPAVIGRASDVQR